jgi:hypothetical protein
MPTELSANLILQLGPYVWGISGTVGCVGVPALHGLLPRCAEGWARSGPTAFAWKRL